MNTSKSNGLIKLPATLWRRFQYWRGMRIYRRIVLMAQEAERLRDRLGRCPDLESLKRFSEPHQPLAHWRSRLTPACAERTTELAHRAARIAHRLFAERPKAFRHRLETLWEHGR